MASLLDFFENSKRGAAGASSSSSSSHSLSGPGKPSSASASLHSASGPVSGGSGSSSVPVPSASASSASAFAPATAVSSLLGSVSMGVSAASSSSVEGHKAANTMGPRAPFSFTDLYDPAERGLGGMPLPKADLEEDIRSPQQALVPAEGIPAIEIAPLVTDSRNPTELNVLRHGGISTLVSSNRCLLIGTRDGHLLHIKGIDNKMEITTINLKKPEAVGYVALDPTGHHMIASFVSQENYYVNLAAPTKIRRIEKKELMSIRSVAWNFEEGSPESTGPILFGTSESTIWEGSFSVREGVKGCTKLYSFQESMDDSSPVLGLETTVFPKSGSSEHKKIFVLASTRRRLYQFVGMGQYQSVLENRVQAPPREMPGDLPFSELDIVRPDGCVPTAFAWLVQAGIFQGQINLRNHRQAGDSVIVESGLTPNPPIPGVSDPRSGHAPRSVALTEYLLLALYPRMLRVYSNPPHLASIFYNGENSETNLQRRLILEYDDFELDGDEDLLRIVKNEGDDSSLWIFSRNHIFEVFVVDQSAGVWKTYLEVAVDREVNKPQFFEDALQHCEHIPEYEEKVRAVHADFLFQEEDYHGAARLYARTDRSFEEVALKFVELGESQALQLFLEDKLACYDEDSDVTQVTCLATWLAELYLDELNNCEDNIESYKSVEKNFIFFLKTHASILCRAPAQTIFSLINHHGRTKIMLEFATYIQDFERKISYYISDQKFCEALHVLVEEVEDEEKKQDLFYRFSPTLMEHIPVRMVEVLQEQETLIPVKLIPALMRYDIRKNEKEGQENQVIKYLEWCIFDQGNRDMSIHNLLISLYAQNKCVKSLREMLYSDASCFDLKYALHRCLEEGLFEPAVILYSTMELHVEAVSKALENGDVKLAKKFANAPPENQMELRKKLWKLIAEYVIQQKGDVKTAVEFLEKSRVLKIEDILPLFPPNTLIESFKNEICVSLDEYNTEIKRLQEQMSDAEKSSHTIKEDIKLLRQRHRLVSTSQLCDLSKQRVYGRAFYLFPCGHCFLRDALMEELERCCSASLMARIRSAEAEVLRLKARLEMESGPSTMHPEDTRSEGFERSTVRGSSSKKRASTAELLKLAEAGLDRLIADECIFCGHLMINSITKPFVAPEEDSLLARWDV